MLVLLGIIAVVITLALAPLLIKIAIRLNATDYSRNDTTDAPTVPRLGGVLVFAASALTMLLISPWWPDSISAFPGSKEKLLALLLGALLFLFLGILDDIHGLRARWKLLGQIGIAILVWWMGLRIEVITNLFNVSSPIYLGIFSLPIFVFWVVLCVNALNIIDGLDCLAGGIATLGTLFFFVQALLNGQQFMMGSSLVVLCVLMIFLIFNYKKRMYLGDSGSMLLGFLMACYVPLSIPKSSGFASVMIPLGVLSVPIAEVIATALRRLLQGKPVGSADLGHIHYRLVRLGISTRRVSIIINLICFCCGILALGMTKVFLPEIAIGIGILWGCLLLAFFAFGYFSPHKLKMRKFYIRNTLFLDAERIMRKELASLKRDRGDENLGKILDLFMDFLDLRWLKLELTNHMNESILSRSAGKLSDSENGLNYLYMTIGCKTGNLTGTINSHLNTESRSDLDRVNYWLKLLLHEVAESFKEFEDKQMNKIAGLPKGPQAQEDLPGLKRLGMTEMS